MSANRKYTFKKILAGMVWILLGSGTVLLLVAAITRKNNEHCTKIEIDITGVQNNYFIDKKDVLDILQKANGGSLEMELLRSIDLAFMETELQKSQWIKKAELFVDNNNVLEVKITEREPIARVFTASGSSFYMDSSLVRLPLSEKFSARLPVFTNFPAEIKSLSGADRELIREIRLMSEFIGGDPFWMAQIEQVDISPGHTFDLIPKFGNHVIHFGKAENYHQKFSNLLCFYRQVISKKGWSQYSSVNMQFTGQIVAVRRGTGEIKMDSLRSVQIMKAIIAEAQKQTNDSTSIQLEQPEDNNRHINISKENENLPDEDVTGNIKVNTKDRVSVSPIHVPEKPVFENQPDVKKNVLISHPSSAEKTKITAVKKQPLQNIKEKPKAVMPPASDY